MRKVVSGGSQIQLLARRTHKIPHTFVLTAEINYSKMLQSKSSKGKGCVGDALGKPALSFQRSSAHVVTQDMPNSSSNKLTTRGKWCPPGSLLETPRPGVLLGAGPMDILCRVPIRIPGSQKESGRSA